MQTKIDNKTDSLAALFQGKESQQVEQLKGDQSSLEFMSILNAESEELKGPDQDLLKLLKSSDSKEESTSKVDPELKLMVKGKSSKANFKSPLGQIILNNDSITPERKAGAEVVSELHLPNQLPVKTKMTPQKAAVKSKEIFLVEGGDDFVNQSKVLNTEKNINTEKLISSETKAKNKFLNTYQKEAQTLNKNIIKAPFADFSTKVKSQIGEESEIKPSESIDSIDFQKVELSSSLGLNEQMFSEGKSGDNMGGDKSAQVIDLSSIKANSSQELAAKIGKYIEQSYLANEESVDMTVTHKDLGQFRIIAGKGEGANQVNLEIQTMTETGQQFFADNESELIKSLSQTGIKVSQVKITGDREMAFFGDGQKSFTGEGDGRQSGSGFSSQSENREGFGRDQRDRDSQRRQDIWREFEESEHYASA